MLSRAAVRALRLRPVPLQATFPSFQQRGLAKPSKPKKPFDYKIPKTTARTPGSRISSEAPRAHEDTLPSDPKGIAVTASKSSDRSEKLDFSAAHDEKDRVLEKVVNNVPSSQLGPGRPTPETAGSSYHQDYSKLQDELETSFRSENNTTPHNVSPSTIDSAKTREQEEQQKEVQFNIHDLTKGIPSTLDAELAEPTSSDKSDTSSVTQISTGGRGDRQLPASAYMTSNDRRRNSYMNWMFASAFLFTIIAPVYLGRNWETEEEEKKYPDAPSGWGVGLFYNRVKARLGSTLDYYSEPAFPKLLPNPDPAWERPYTLVLSLQDLLLHSEWTREHGWRMAKRPGVDYFLRYLSQYYELVIFTSEMSTMADPWIRKLDPYRIIMWPLYREATRYKNGDYVKDLSYLNRPLSKIIMVDTVPAHASQQPENAIILPKWTGNPNDNELVSLIPFLEYVASMGFDDTRDVLKSFEGKNIATEFAAREAQARERFEAQIAADKAKRPRRSGVGLLGSALGIKTVPGGMDGMMGENFSQGFDQGKMLQDQIRERGQKQYELLEKEIRENGEKWLKDMAVEEKRASDEAMKSMKSGMFGWFRGAGENKDSGH